MAKSDRDGAPLDRVLFLTRARSRVRIIEYLFVSGAAAQRELRSHLDLARTTISRSLQSLTEAGWVERSEGTYRLTPAGRIVADEFIQLLDTMEAVEELSQFLRWFPADVDAPDFADVDDFEVTYPTDADPYAPARKQTDIIHTAERLCILLPAIDRDSTEAITEQVTDRGLEVETVVSPDVESTIESDEFAPLIEEMIRTERSSIVVAQESLPFYLGLADDGFVQIGLADTDGFPVALFETADERVGEWADDVYREFREGAEPKRVAEFDDSD